MIWDNIQYNLELSMSSIKIDEFIKEYSVHLQNLASGSKISYS